jgi:hypothetical protein
MKGLALTATFLVLMAAVATAKSIPVKKMTPTSQLVPRELYDIPVITARNCRDLVARVRPLQISPRIPILLPPLPGGLR